MSNLDRRAALIRAELDSIATKLMRLVLRRAMAAGDVRPLLVEERALEARQSRLQDELDRHTAEARGRRRADDPWAAAG